MHNFQLDKGKCISCGSCAADCFFGVLQMKDGNPVFAQPDHCIGCLHCFAICPTGAITMDDHDPATALAKGAIPSTDEVAAFIRQRRSIRQFKEENIDQASLRKLLDLAWSAPSGINQHRLQVSVIADLKEMANFKKGVYERLKDMKQAGKLKNDYLAATLGPDPDAWLENDALFRHAPHMVVVSAAPDAATGIPDSFIYLSYLEMLACAMGFGTLWCGLVFGILNNMPETARQLGISADHKIGHVMLLVLQLHFYELSFIMTLFGNELVFPTP